MSPCLVHEGFFGENHPILDCYWARRLIEIDGLFEYANNPDREDVDINDSKNRMTDDHVYNLINRLLTDEDDFLLNDLRNSYNENGFLIFIDQNKKTIVYAENINSFQNWFQTAVDDGPSSEDVFKNFYLSI